MTPTLAFSTTTPIVIEASQAPQKAPETLQTQVYRLAEEYNQDPQLAMKIIKCEGQRYVTQGNNKNLDKNGNVWSTDVGPWQINDYYHQARAKSLGLDIYSQEDNIRYGFILMKEQGTSPWSASRYCWNK